METLKITAVCDDGYGPRTYGTYIGFTDTEVEALADGLPTNWLVLVERAD